MTVNFDCLYTILLEQVDFYSGNGYELLASTMNMYPGKKYNFYDKIKEWYTKNTQLTPEEVEVMLQAKAEHASKEVNPYFEKIDYKIKDILLTSPEQWPEIEQLGGYNPNRIAAYVQEYKRLYLNPNKTFKNSEELINTILHELLHSIQQSPMPQNMDDPANFVTNIYNPNQRISPLQGDEDISSNYVYHFSKPVELDPVLGEVSRAITKMKNIMIYPNDIETAEKELRYILDPKNWNQIPKEFQEIVSILSRILTGRSKQEQDRLIKLFAQRMSLLAKNIPKNKQISVA